MPEFTQSWSAIKTYLDQGINIIPVDTHKKPFKNWKHWQTNKVTEQELWESFNQTGAENGAMVLGAVSGNLFVIDIDSKYYHGFDAIYFSAIKEFYPELWDKLRIHKTPSGGYHIIYRTPTPGGNKKLASRLMTPEEESAHRIAHPNDRTKVLSKCFLETKGEGGLTNFPPSVGYSVFKKAPIPQLTEQEHQSLITLGSTYNQVLKVVTPPKPTVYDNDYYDEDPWTHFNNSPEAEMVLEKAGWVPGKQSSQFQWYSRPGTKGDIHASFNKAKRVYYIFTTSTQFEPDQGYHPSTALSIIQHRGDKKATYKWLVDNGFGKVKPQKERAAIKKMARTKTAPPANFSQAAKEEFAVTAEKLKALHPHGVFWGFDKEKITISRDAFYRVASALGFCLLEDQLHILTKNIIAESDERTLQDAMYNYIQEPEEVLAEDIRNSLESFMQKSGKFSITRLPIINKSRLLRDTKSTCYKIFRNGIIKITAKECTPLNYSDVIDIIEYKKIKQRDFALNDSPGIYEDFLSKAVNWSQDEEHVRKIIGYLSHEYKDETTGFIIVLTEQCPDPKDGGGSGKNLFCKILENTTSYHSKNGGQVSYDEKFFQSWSGQKIMGISDVPKNFRFEFLKEPSTGEFTHKKLYRDERVIPVEDGPKFIIHTNFSYEITDGGLKRRIIPIEFTDFFTKAGGVDAHFGVHFPSGWTEEDWNKFDTFIIGCVQKWLNSGLKLKSVPLSETGYEKQFEHTYGKHLTEFINDNFDTWVRDKQLVSETLATSLKLYYNDNDVPMQYRPSKNKVADAIKEFAKHRQIPIKSNQLLWDGMVQRKGYQFLSPE